MDRLHNASMTFNDKLQILLTDDEKRTWKLAARRYGMSLSAFVRFVMDERTGMHEPAIGGPSN